MRGRGVRMEGQRGRKIEGQRNGGTGRWVGGIEEWMEGMRVSFAGLPF